MIPSRISQTWKTHELPEAAKPFRQGWHTHHPDFDIRLFDDAEARAVVTEVAPGDIEVYDALPFPVMRADLFRYAVMVRDGGIYADIDMECRKPLTPLLVQGSCLLGIEAHLGATRQRELGYAAPFQIANCVFAAQPGHPFFVAALARAFALIRAAPKLERAMVEDLTGPRMLTRLLFERAWPGVMLAPQIVLMAPLFYPAFWPFDALVRTRHHTFGTWKTGEPVSLYRRWIERNRLVSPFPARLVEPAEAALARFGIETGGRP